MSSETNNIPAGTRAAVETAAQWRPSFNPWLIAVSVMLATFMEVLDTSVANVALPHIAGNLSASTDQATWVLTSYLVSNAIVLPATGWLSTTFGRKRLLIFCIMIFTASSLLCGAATSLPVLILARVIQGAGGGALQPIAQAVMLESFPPQKRGAAMAVYGMGVVVAPIIGPTLGGWITDNYSWRWVFYINIPVGILAVMMSQWFVEDPPYIKNAKRSGIDYVGFGFMALWLATLQIMLDKGQDEDWFSSSFIVWLTVISVVSFAAFIVWELRVKDPIVNLRVLKNRNFAVGTALIAVVGLVLYGTTALLPLFLQNLLGYSALQSGLAVSPRGFGSMLAMILVARLIGLIDSRWLIGFGFGILGLSVIWLGGINLNIAPSTILWPIVISGLAMGFIFVPLSTTAVGTLRNEEMGNATGLYNLMRNIGGSIGISAVTTMLARGAQTHQVPLTSHLTPYDATFQQQLQAMTAKLAPQVGQVAAQAKAMAMMYGTVVKQAMLLAFVDEFRLLGLLCLLCIPTVLLLKRAKSRGPVVAH
ncbi:MAG TPA: DHA2 family efflux MFS transporter permease subunit [Blastocatellia bacterium]|nr:DHA2 family efflux MFS transporter permease subunit [Blastocatellia bacterium]